MREPGVESLDTLVEAGMARDAADPTEFDGAVGQGSGTEVAALFFTSGTTGSPKGVMHTYAALIDRSLAGARFDRHRNGASSTRRRAVKRTPARLPALIDSPRATYASGEPNLISSVAP